MNTVEPIRDEYILKRFYRIAREHDGQRRNPKETSWELLITVGFSTAYRISDILNMRVGDIRDKRVIYIKEKKTGKERRCPINEEARRKIKMLTAGRDPDEYLFESIRPDRFTHRPRPITRQHAYVIVNEIAKRAGVVDDRIGCHTLRKTYGYLYFKKWGNIEELKDILRHSSADVTERYIGLKTEITENHQSETKTVF